MPQNWKTYKLGDVGQLIKESIDPINADDVPYLGLEHIGQGNFQLDGIGNSSDVTSNKYKFINGDILYGKLRPYFKKVYQPPFDGICSTDIFVIRSSNEKILDQKYLYQIIRDQSFTDYAMQVAKGTRMPRADWNYLERKPITLPSLPIQRRIASILGALDDKIELNLEMNKTLEEMAMALYKHWFVDFGPFQDGNFVESELGMIPEGWEVKRLGEIYVSNRGLSYKGKFLSKQDGLPLHNLNSVYEGGYYKREGIKYYTGGYKERHIANPSDLIVTNTEQGHKYLLIGCPALIPKSFESGLYSHHLYKMEPIHKHDTIYIYYKLLDPGFRSYVTAYCNGTTVNMLGKEGMSYPKLVVPPPEIIAEFKKIVTPFHKQKENNIEENQLLAQTRDTLLPKLISGEVEVKAAEEEVSQVV